MNNGNADPWDSKSDDDWTRTAPVNSSFVSQLVESAPTMSALTAGALGSAVVRIAMPPDPGAAGQKGDKGDKGDPGEKGDKGDKGDPGEPAQALPTLGETRLIAVLPYGYGKTAWSGSSIGLTTADQRNNVGSLPRWDPHGTQRPGGQGQPFFVAPSEGWYDIDCRIYLHSMGETMVAFTVPFVKTSDLTGEPVGYVQAETSSQWPNNVFVGLSKVGFVYLHEGEGLAVKTGGAYYGTASGNQSNVGRGNSGWDPVQLSLFIKRVQP